MRVCPSCGERNPDRFRLCGICGTALATATARAELRKTVTIVFSDLQGSTDLGERLDPEALREVLARYFGRMQAVLEGHGGTVEKFIGDAIMAVFGLPRQHDDDAIRAVRAAAEMRTALAELNDDLERIYGVRLTNRTGVNTGEVVAGDVSTGQRLATGDAVNVAARLEQAAPPTEVLLGEPTYRLVRHVAAVEPVEPLDLKGKSEPVPAYLLLDVSGTDLYERRTDTPIVGRDGELALLEDSLREAVDGPGVRLVTVIAPAGMGKSRLFEAFRERMGDRTRMVHGRCPSYGEDITYRPLAEIVREATGVAEGEEDPQRLLTALEALVPAAPEAAERVAAAIGVVDTAFAAEDIFWGARLVLEGLARDRPLVVVIDDLHRAEPTFVDLLRHVVETSRGVPILLLCAARPELLEGDAEPVAEEGSPATATIHLERLSEDEAENLTGNLLGGPVDPALRALVTRAAEGNPLFVEQLLRMLEDGGELVPGAGGVWSLAAGDDEVRVPSTISALLAARLDGLPDDEAEVTGHAAVVGRRFSGGAVKAMATEDLREETGVCLLSLARRGLVEPGEAPFVDEEGMRFANGLIRDAAYDRLLKRTRAELHERFVGWLESAAAGRMLEYGEMCGYHLEQAYRARIELAPPNEESRVLARRAATYLAEAGRRAADLDDRPASVNLVRRTLALLEPDDPRAPELRLLLADGLFVLGEFAEASEVLALAETEAAGLGETGLEITCRIARLRLRYTVDPEEGEEEVVRIVDEAIERLGELEDHRGLARAWMLLGIVHGTACRFGEAEAANLRAIEHARAAGERRLEMSLLGGNALCTLYGPTPVPEAIRRCEDMLEEVRGDRGTEAALLTALSHLSAMAGEFGRARDLYARARSTLEELGSRVYAALVSIDSGSAELLAGEPAAAERELRRDYDALHAMGEHNYVSTTAALLAEALYRQGRIEEAGALAEESREEAAPDDLDSQVMWRCVRAKVLVSEGGADAAGEAVALVTEAVGLLDATDELDARAGAFLDLAEVLRLTGREAEAQEQAARAIDLYERKGNVVAVAGARAFAAG